MKPVFYIAPVLFLAGSAFISVSAKRIPAFAGPYRIVVLKVYNGSEDYNSTGKFWGQLHTTQVRGQQLQYGWGYSYTSVPLTDDIQVEINFAVQSNNQWKKNAFVIKFDKGCTLGLQNGRALFELIYGSDHDLTCPTQPRGLREIRNHSFELHYPITPVFPYGRYLFSMALTKDQETYGVFVSEIDIVPRV